MMTVITVIESVRSIICLYSCETASGRERLKGVCACEREPLRFVEQPL